MNDAPSPIHPTKPATSDSAQLKRFVATRDESAFTELVSRYSGMVLGVCGRVLPVQQDVEDAFQAVFLVLAGDVAKIRKRRSIASWLYGVAHRISLRALARRYRRREESLQEDVMGQTNPLAELASRHEQEAVDDELNQLPEKYREPLILYYLMGQTSQQVAEKLKLSLSATEGRLRRGREKLRGRLARRGIGMVAVLTAIQLSQSTVEAAVTKSLVTGTVQAGISYCGAGHSSPLISQEAAQLAGKEIGMMSIPTTAAVTTAAIVALTIGISGHTATSDAAPGGQPMTVQATATNADAATSAVRPVTIAAEKRVGEPLSAVGGDARNGVTAAAIDAKPPTERERMVKALASTTKCEFVDTPLKDAILYFSRLHNINIVLDAKALADLKIDTSTPVSVTLSGVTLKSALKVVLSPLKLGHVVEDEVLKITTDAAAVEKAKLDAENIMAVAENARKPAVDYKRRSELVTKIETALEDTSQDMDYVDSTLKEVIEDLRDRYKVAISVDAKAVNSGEIELDSIVNLTVSGVSFRNALGLILEPLDLDFVMRNGLMQIVTAERAEELTDVRVYAVGHLKSIKPEELAELIQQSIRPASWRHAPSNRITNDAQKEVNAGRTGFIKSIGTGLVITQSQRGHHEIARFLEQLKRHAEHAK